MKKRILGYVKSIDELLEGGKPEESWEEEIKKHLIQIGFFQHERLIHLLVTLTFAILTVAAMLVMVISSYLPLAAVFGLLLILLVPYIKHYYLLENKTQYMYEQYDKMLTLAREEKNKNSDK
ncbi:MAG: hypothetical protein IKS39_00080 [Clostridia bacterium]|jgi:hypothetical protein|nr:hypothetical protein [Clostridia bacterium]